MTIICSDDYHRYSRAERAENGLSALDRKAKIGPNLNVRHTLRPTLPHPDLTPIRDVGGRNGFQLRLARDIDGKPVDIKKVAGDIDGKRAAEDLLWSLLPEAHHLRTMSESTWTRWTPWVPAIPSPCRSSSSPTIW